MYTAIAIDDEPLALTIITEFCHRHGNISLTTFDNPLQAIEAIRISHPDILFLDIEMNDISGLHIAQDIPKQTSLIFTTAFAEYAIDGYALRAIDFLHKPFSFARFSQAVNRAIETIDIRKKAETIEDSAPKLIVKSDYKTTSIHLSDILYIESMENYVKIHTTAEETIVTISTLKNIASQLPTEQFLRIHRSFIVASSHVTHRNGKTITLANKTTLPIGRSFK